MHGPSILTPVHFHLPSDGTEWVIHAFDLVNCRSSPEIYSKAVPQEPGGRCVMNQFRTGHFVKCDTYRSSEGRKDQTYEASSDRGQRRDAQIHRLERRLWESRLNRALRRFQEQIRSRIQRRCELRLFVILRMQFVYRSRSRLRAAMTIQRFMRRKRRARQLQYLY